MTRRANILLWDLEISRTRFNVEQYGRKLYSQYLKSQDIVRPRTILSAAYMHLDDDRAKVISCLPSDPFNDEGVVKAMHPILAAADIIVGHNNDRFDVKNYCARALYYGLPPLDLRPKYCADTLKLAKKYHEIDANDLRYLARFLKLETEKDETPDWDKIHAGDPDEWRKMREYNKKDVLVLKGVYLKLRPWDTRHPNVAHMEELKDAAGKLLAACRVCGSPDLVSNGHRIRYGTGLVKRKQLCKNCGAHNQDEQWRKRDGLERL